MADVKTPATGSGADSSSERRRTHRLQIMMPVIVRGKSGGHPFEEETQTVSVNANGCMVKVSAHLSRAQHVSIINPKTAEELPCRVSYVGQRDGSKIEIGLEFSEPSPLFWRIAFPPEDWDPSERKRPSAPRQSPKR
ncbi:MAG TPA: PilZ domain-containing protein [Candidatus Acidoferrales bacterium]|nr:PilZ domain-containing protein [Candidatus Acidoferrales bacterium]